MTNPNLGKAREWAKGALSDGPFPPYEVVAARLIQSLPDQWVDTEKVREITDRHNDLIVDFLDQIEGDMNTDTWEAIRDFMCELNVEVDTLAIPKLPTLADMTPEQRAASQWSQAEVKLTPNSSPVRWVIAHPGSGDMKVSVWAPYGRAEYVEASQVTPLPHLTKLKWPSNSPEEPYKLGGTASESDLPFPGISERTKGNPAQQHPVKPEDVPAEEEWLVDTVWRKGIAKRSCPHSDRPWVIAGTGYVEVMFAKDSEITLIRKAGPEDFQIRAAATRKQEGGNI